MSIKGFPTSQKINNENQPTRHEFATMQPQDEALRFAMDVHSRFAFRVDDGTTPRTAGASTGNPSDGSGTVVVDTATPARVGDFVRFVTGQATSLEVPIVSVSTNSFKLGAKLASTLVPSAGDTFFIMRYATQLVDEFGAQQVSVTSGPVAYDHNGTDTEVKLDTVTPANSRALPVRQIQANGQPVDVATEATLQGVEAQLLDLSDTFIQDGGAAALMAIQIAGNDGTASQFVKTDSDGNLQIDILSSALPSGAATEAKQDAMITEINNVEFDIEGMSAKLPAALGQTNMAGSLSVTLASNQSNVPTREASNANGSNTDSTVSTVATLTAPANSVGFILMNLDSSGANIRWRIGAVATSSAGQQLQPGRDTGYIPCAANISICAESGTQNYNIQWILSA